MSQRLYVRMILVDEVLNLKEFADYLKMAERTAYKQAAEGKLPRFKVLGQLALQTLKCVEVE